MCCLFGIYAYKGGLTAAQKRRLVSALATASEDRGTDATGISYNSDGHLVVYKRPWPAHLMRFRPPENVRCVMGHTHMTIADQPRLRRPLHRRLRRSLTAVHRQQLL